MTTNIIFCKECDDNTMFRYLDCDEHESECNEIICCECGSSQSNEVIEQ